jgi:putative ABC transport system permease protein
MGASFNIGATFKMESLVQDLGYGARILRKAPAFTALIVCTLALGIGANTAVFSIVQAVLLRPLPYRDPSRLVLTFVRPVHDKDTGFFVQYRDFQEWSRKNRSYETMAAATWARGPRFLLGRGAPQSILAIPVTVDFFSMLGVPPQLGRTFTRDDLPHGCSLVLAHSFWQNHLGGQAGIVGQHLTLEDSSCTVAGVMPSSFVFFPAPTDMWTLITPGSELDRNPDRNGVAVFGRLRPGVSRASAETELRALAYATDRGRRYGTEMEPVSFDVQQEFTWLVGHDLRLSLLVLFGAVGLVLLITCVNVANLLLSRALVRRRELAIRAALGSSRTRLLRQLLTESLLLCLSAALLGTGIAAAAVYCFKLWNPVELPPGATLSVNIPVLMFTLGLALVTTILFGFVPAWNSSKVGVSEALKSGGRNSTGGPSGQLFAKGLIATEIMLSLVLLVGAGLLIQSIANYASAPLGFVPDRLLTMTVSLPPLSYPKPQQQTAFYDQVKSRVQALPGVEGVGMSSYIALKGSNGLSPVLVEGHAPDPKNVILDTEQQYITDGYFGLMGISFERGRDFQWTDRAPAVPVAVVNQALVRRRFPHEDPLGQRIRFPDSDNANPWLTIVGIAGDEKQKSPFQEMTWTDPPIVYRPLTQQPSATVDLVVRVASRQALSSARIQQEILKLGPDVRISDVYPMQHELDRYTAYPRFRATLMGAFAGFALLLAVVGLYGVLAQLVVQRTPEIGIRMALGAQGRDVLFLIMKQGMLLTGIGAAVGLLAALALTRFLGSLLYGVQPNDPLILGGVSLALIFAALLAAYVPARRATRVNPIDSLRAE